MALEQYFHEAMPQNEFSREHESCSEKWQSGAASLTGCDDNRSGGFDCNICLDYVQDPVVTLCGHLFCWPCIYKWLHFQSTSAEKQEQQQLQCPVCKAEVSQATLVPLYGRSQTTKPPKGKAPNLGIMIPRRPLGPVYGVDTPRSLSTFSSPRVTQQGSYAQQAQLGSYTRSSSMVNLGVGGAATNLSHPIIGMLGEMVYARVFGNSVTNMYTNSYRLAGSNSPRVRRHVMQADKSLSRVCFFFLCCVVLCLVLF